VALDRAADLAAQRLRSQRAGQLQTVLADLLSYRPAPGSFDLVLVVYLQVPAKPRRTVLRAAAEAVAPGGLLLVVAHDSANLSDGVGGPQDPTVLYTAADVAADVADTGLVIERSEELRRPVVTEDGPCAVIDALFLARRSTDSPSPTQETTS